jgi:uncharacterized membrane protein YhaH (DUF805 family)
MTTLVFDTHVYVKRLHAVGFSEEQAEVVVALQQEAVNATLVSSMLTPLIIIILSSL